MSELILTAAIIGRTMKRPAVRILYRDLGKRLIVT